MPRQRDFCVVNRPTAVAWVSNLFRVGVVVLPVQRHALEGLPTLVTNELP